MFAMNKLKTTDEIRQTNIQLLIRESNMNKLKTIDEIRLANLRLLIKESKLAGESGTKSVAAKCGTSASYLSQITTRFVFPDTKKCKEVGTALARKLEVGCGKPAGWMDTPHPEQQQSPDEEEIISLYLAMSNEMQATFLSQARAIVKMGSGD